MRRPSPTEKRAFKASAEVIFSAKMIFLFQKRKASCKSPPTTTLATPARPATTPSTGIGLRQTGLVKSQVFWWRHWDDEWCLIRSNEAPKTLSLIKFVETFFNFKTWRSESNPNVLGFRVLGVLNNAHKVIFVFDLRLWVLIQYTTKFHFAYTKRSIFFSSKFAVLTSFCYLWNVSTYIVYQF